MPNVITVELLSNIFKNFQSKFNEGMQRGRPLPSGVDPKYFITLQDLALTVPSVTGVEVHAWLQQLPGFREWLDDRTKKAIAAQAMNVPNRDWEDTVKVPRNDVEDDRFGLYAPLMELMGQEAGDNAIWLDMAIDALEAGLTTKWIDDKNFFATDRKFGANTINNYVNSTLTRTNFMTAWGNMVAFKGQESKPVHVMPAVLLVAPALFGTARILMESEKITETGAQVDNPCRGLAAVKMHPNLAATSWYLLGQKGGVKAVASQRRREAQFVAKDKPTDDNVFDKKEFVYGADLRGTAFLTLPHLAIKGQ